MYGAKPVTFWYFAVYSRFSLWFKVYQHFVIWPTDCLELKPKGMQDILFKNYVFAIGLKKFVQNVFELNAVFSPYCC